MVSVVDVRDGVVRKLTGEFWAEEGLAWSPDGHDVLFSASSGQGGEPYQAMAVNVSGPPLVRQVVATPAAIVVQDMARAGRMLTFNDESRTIPRVLVPGESAERDAPWLDFAFNGYLSRDGKWLAFTDGNQSAGVNYQAALRDMTPVAWCASAKVSSSASRRMPGGYHRSCRRRCRWRPTLLVPAMP